MKGRIIDACVISSSGQHSHGEHQPPSFTESGGLFQIIPAHGIHVREDECLIGCVSVLDHELAIFYFCPGDGLMIDEVKVDPRGHEFVAKMKGDLRCLFALGFCLIGRDRVDDGDISHGITLAHQVREAVEVLKKGAHMLPIGHAEMVAWRRPFPVRAVGGVIETVQVE